MKPVPPPPNREQFLLNGYTAPAWVTWFNQIWTAAYPNYATLPDCADDAAAAAAGVLVGQLYRTANAIKVRLT